MDYRVIEGSVVLDLRSQFSQLHMHCKIGSLGSCAEVLDLKSTELRWLGGNQCVGCRTRRKKRRRLTSTYTSATKPTSQTLFATKFGNLTKSIALVLCRAYSRAKIRQTCNLHRVEEAQLLTSRPTEESMFILLLAEHGVYGSVA